MSITFNMLEMSSDDILQAIKQINIQRNDKLSLLVMLIKNQQCQPNVFDDLTKEIELDIKNLAALDEEIIRRNNTVLKFNNMNYTVIQLLKLKANKIIELDFNNKIVSTISESTGNELIDKSLLAFRNVKVLQSDISTLTKTIQTFNNTKGKNL